MKAVSRWGNALLAAALALAPWPACAQEAPPASNPPAGSTPPADAVGPKELQNFTLNGTVTRQADQPAAKPPSSEKRQPPTEARTVPAPSATRPATAEVAESPAARAPRSTQTASVEPSPPTRSIAPPAAEPLRQSPSSSVTVALPKLGGTPDGSESNRASTSSFAPAPEAPGTLAPERKLPVMPWLLAALALVGGAMFLFFRNRGREAFAGGPQFAAFTAPEPAPVPVRAPPPPSPAPPPRQPEAPSPASLGIVSTRLRPWIEIGFQPVRCILEDQRVVVDLELELFNSGSAPARAVLAEATLINAGATQDQQVEAFFASPVGEGERIVAIAPLKRIVVRTQVVAPRAQIQAYELGGRQVFVPVIAFNVLYGWSGGEGQTSVSYLLGRDTKGEKMGPFRLDLGPRIFRGVAARLLPAGVRR